MHARRIPLHRYLAAAALSLITASPAFAADGSSASPTAVTITLRPSVLMPMYAVSFGLQGYDAYSTTTLVNAGGRELNPIMSSVVKSPAAFTAVKLAAATATCVLSERLWKTHHRTAAVALMTATNIGLAIVATNNTLRFRGSP